MEDTTLEQEMKRIQGGERLHSATIAYELSNVEWHDGFLFKAGWKDRLLTAPPEEKAAREHIVHGTLSGTYFGSLYFGHWMTDDLSLNAAAENTGDPVIPQRKAYSHEDGYKRMFEMSPRKVGRATFERLTILDDIGQNSYKRRRYQLLRSRILGIAKPATGRRIMLHRGSSGVSRRLENELEIEALLEKQGFSIIDATRLTAEELASQTVGAQIVIGVEGSQLAHALYSIADHGVMCALQPPYRFNNIFKDQADCLGFHYAFLTGEATEAGFRVSLDEMSELVERLSNVLVTGRKNS